MLTSEQVFVGSFIELLSMFLLLNIFDDYLKKWTQVVFIAFIAALITIFTDLYTVDFPIVGYIINYSSVILCFAVIFKKNVIYMILEFFFASAIVVFIEFIFIYTVINSIVGGSEGWGILTHLIPIFILSFILSQNKKLQISIRSAYNRFKFPFSFIFANIFVGGIVVKYLWDTNRTAMYDDFGVSLFFICIWWAINAYLMKKLIGEQNQKNTIRFHEQYGEMAQRLLDELYGEQHDFRKHLQAIEGMTYMADPCQGVEGIRDYIKTLSVTQGIKEEKTISFNMGNSVIDGLLYAKQKEANREQITFHYVPGELFPSFPCHLYELTELLGNLLDNAFDYVKDLSPEERVIVLCIGLKTSKPYIEVRNTYYAKEKENFQMMKKKGYSTKPGERRGYGLYNVKRICTKYHGHLHIFHEDDQLVIQASF